MQTYLISALGRPKQAPLPRFRGSTCRQFLAVQRIHEILSADFLLMLLAIYIQVLATRIAKKVLNMNLGTTRLRGRPRNRWQDEVREDGRIVGGEGWQKKVHDSEEWKKLLRTARNRRILRMPMNECISHKIEFN